MDWWLTARLEFRPQTHLVFSSKLALDFLTFSNQLMSALNEAAPFDGRPY
jgi:hypothetical protein